MIKFGWDNFWIYSPIQIVEEWENEEGHLAPGFFLAEFERVSIHDGRWIVEKLLSVCGAVEVPAENGKKHKAGSASWNIMCTYVFFLNLLNFLYNAKFGLSKTLYFLSYLGSSWRGKMRKKRHPWCNKSNNNNTNWKTWKNWRKTKGKRDWECTI